MFIHFNERRIAEVQSEEEAVEHIHQMEDLLELMDLKEALGEIQIYTLSDEDLHVIPEPRPLICPITLIAMLDCELEDMMRSERGFF